MAASNPFGTLPVVDVSPLVTPEPAGRAGVARQIEAACREHGVALSLGLDAANIGDMLDRLKVSNVFPQLRREVLAEEGP